MIEYWNERERQTLFVIRHLLYEYIEDLGSLLTSFKFLYSFWDSFMKVFGKEIWGIHNVHLFIKNITEIPSI